MADDVVKAARLKNVNSLTFRAIPGLQNLLTLFHQRTLIAAIREAVVNRAFGYGPFSVRMLDSGRLLYGRSSGRTVLNRNSFHHELIHFLQTVMNQNLRTEFSLRIFHEPIQI